MKGLKKAHARRRRFTTQKNKNIDVVPTLNKKQIPLNWQGLITNLQLRFNPEQKSQVKCKELKPIMKNNEKF